jgi:hypothetical protein
MTNGKPMVPLTFGRVLEDSLNERDEYYRADEVDALLERINMLACYASEEDTSAQPVALLEIGKLARKEIAP